MYSETFMNYLLKYQSDDFKPAERKEKTVKNFAFDKVNKRTYVTIPINHEIK